MTKLMLLVTIVLAISAMTSTAHAAVCGDINVSWKGSENHAPADRARGMLKHTVTELILRIYIDEPKVARLPYNPKTFQDEVWFADYSDRFKQFSKRLIQEVKHYNGDVDDGYGCSLFDGFCEFWLTPNSNEMILAGARSQTWGIPACLQLEGGRTILKVQDFFYP